MKPILEVAKSLGIDPAHLEPYGHWKAKLALAAYRGRPRRGKLVLVSAITPTPAGEGKTTTSVGLAQGLAKIGVRAAVPPRELEARRGHERPRVARHRHRARRAHRGHPARDRLRHHRRERGDGDPVP